MSYLALSFASGIWAADVFPFKNQLGCLLAALAVVAWVLRRVRWLSALLLSGCFALLGAFRSVGYEGLPSDHYSRHIGSGDRDVSLLRIVASDKVTAKYFRYTARVKGISRDGVFVPAEGLVLLQVKRGGMAGRWVSGTELWVDGKWVEAPGAMNPFQFDYRKYLARKGIRHQLFVGEGHWVVIRQVEGLRRKIDVFKALVVDKLRGAGFAERELTLFRALLLGDRTEMDVDMRTRYARAGAMHFLAISGLHAGIVFSIVYFLLYPLVFLPHGRACRIVCALAAIWCFAFFVDFSASVSRASLMLSIYYFSVLMRRRPDLYHTLALSALILLCIRPSYLFDVGFQLSYIAVFSIGYLYGVFRLWLRSGNFLPDYFLGLVSMTLAAQLGTMPISLYYFHCFPMLFLLSSLALTPLMFLLLGLGGAVLVLVVSGVQVSWFFEGYNSLLSGMNFFVDGLAFWQWESWNRISVSLPMVVLMYSGIVFFRGFLKSGRGMWALGGLSIFFLVSCLYVWDVYEKWKRREVVVFQGFDPVVGVKVRDTLDVYLGDFSKVEVLKRWLIEPYVVGMRISRVNYFSLDGVRSTAVYLKTENVIQTGRFRLLIMDPSWRWEGAPWDAFDYVRAKGFGRASDMRSAFPGLNMSGGLFSEEGERGSAVWLMGDVARVLPF